MNRLFTGLVILAAASWATSPSAIAQPPAAAQSAARSADPPPPPIVDLTPVDLPDRSHGPIDCITCNNTPPAVLGFAEYLLVRARTNANDYAIIDPANNLAPEGSIRNAQYGTDNAFRIGGGYRPGGSAWDFVFTYFYLHDWENRNAVAPPGGLLYATLTRPGQVDNVGFAVAGASLNMNVYDLESIRNFQIDKDFAFKLGFGSRFANVEQDLQALYFGGDANGAAVRRHVCFDSFGLTVGGQGDWVFWRNFRLYGRARGSLLMADFDNSLFETNNGGATVNANVHEHYRQVVPVIELASGVAWEYRNLRVSVGYELQNWFNVVNAPTFVDDFSEGKLGRRTSDLGIEGFSFRLGYNF